MQPEARVLLQTTLTPPRSFLEVRRYMDGLRKFLIC